LRGVACCAAVRSAVAECRSCRQFYRRLAIQPDMGASFSCSVVIITMMAAMSFDPRLMWDAAGENDE